MAIINRTHGYLFLAEPHCATRAVEAALKHQPGSKVIDAWVHVSRDDLIRKKIILPHEPLYTFSVVRNPADWVVTRYHHLTGWHSRGFKAFLEYHLENHLWDKSVFMHAKDTDRVLRYEFLSQQLNEILESRGASPVRLDRIGVTAGKRAWDSYFTREQLAYMQTNLKDFATYGYRA